MECFANMEPLIASNRCAFALEPLKHAQRFQKEFIVCNAFMATVPKMPFFELVFSMMLNQDNQFVW
jgi:inositol phosphorylceramide mannosyltransferase catalytic subunit